MKDNNIPGRCCGLKKLFKSLWWSTLCINQTVDTSYIGNEMLSINQKLGKRQSSLQIV